MSGNQLGNGGPQAGETSTQRMFFDDDGTPPPPDREERRSIGPLRHLGSLVLALVLTPVALLLIDYGIVRRHRVLVTELTDVDLRAMLVMIAGGALLFIVAASGRLSPLGPLVAGVGYGLVPWILVTFFLQRVLQGLDRLPDIYNGVGTSATFYGFALYAAVAALLVGAGCAARWRRG